MFTKRSLFLKKHSRRVLIFKHAFPVFAFLLATTIAVWPLLTPDKERFDLPLQKTNSNTPSVDMENVRFHAQDEKKRTMTVTSDSVKEVDAQQAVARLERPLAVYSLSDDDVLTALTDYALAYQKDEYFWFENPVKSTTKSGYTAYTSHVKATFSGILDSEKEIKISGPAGSLTAQGFHLQDKGNLIDFKGKTNTKIKSEKGLMTVNTTNGLNINRMNKTITAKENVSVLHQENILTADMAILYYTDETKGRIQKIVATGNVILTKGKNKITGDKGIYNPLTEEMEMMGNVYLYQGASFVTADRATLDMKTGKSQLINKHQGQRIKGTLTPNDFKQ